MQNRMQNPGGKGTQPLSPVFDPQLNRSPEIKLPRPLWQIREELAEHMKVRPPNTMVLALADWNAKKESLEMWIQYAESTLSTWTKIDQHLSGTP